ncbi:MAG TPA: RIP metalloprotease RseP, partial [Candidatus Binatia bacterium]|nr:RIP metalloprotease RseP [Candidatus Binatia bacterium]
MTILRYILVALEVVLLFNLLIGVHELGHFLAARWRGLKVERFAIWFGKPIWKKTVGGVEYALGWIPAGGYVSLPQMATMETIEGKTETPVEKLPPVSPLDKIIVAFAGPLFSFLLAVLFAVVVWQVGKPSNEANNNTTIGWVDPDGPAAKAGLQAGDQIEQIDGHPVHHFSAATADSITWRIVTSTGTNIAIKYLRDGQEGTAYVKPYHRPTKWYERKALRQILITSSSPAIIYDVASNSPAAAAGLKPGDQVTELNGKKIYSFMAVVSAEDAMSNSVVKPITLTVQRGDQQFDRTLTPVKPLQPTNSPPMLGIMSWQGDTNYTLVHPGPLAQIHTSASQIFNTLGALFNKKGDIGVQQLGGAVMIIRVYSNL